MFFWVTLSAVISSNLNVMKKLWHINLLPQLAIFRAHAIFNHRLEAISHWDQSRFKKPSQLIHKLALTTTTYLIEFLVISCDTIW